MTNRALLWVAVSSLPQAAEDKSSLPKQEADLRSLAEREGWQVVDALNVPGHSRRYIDIHKLAIAAERHGIAAFRRLLQHLEAKDFDVIAVRDADRFARTQTLMSYIVESVITNGARIYSLADGWVDEHNYRMFIAMAGYRSAGAIDALIKGQKAGKDAAAKHGLPTTSKVPLSHILIRDPQNGRAVRLEVNESRRRLWNDLAVLILEGVSWGDIDLELYKRFGHVNSHGEPFALNSMYRLIMNPMFWGHSARHHADSLGVNGQRKGMWIFDESEPIPEGVQCYRNTHPPVYTGELSENLRAELRRRMTAIKGRASPGYTQPFSGLLVCAECGYAMETFNIKPKKKKAEYRALRCSTRLNRKGHRRTTCTNTKVINERKVKAYYGHALERMIQLERIDVFEVEDAEQSETSMIDSLTQEISGLESQVRVLIREQSYATDEDVQKGYRAELQQIGDRLRILRAAKQDAEQRVSSKKQTAYTQQNGLSRIQGVGLEGFWDLDGKTINQMLHQVMGKRRLMVLNGEIVGVQELYLRQPKR